ncbi:MAG: hypothetical protein ABF301_04330 [Sulfurovum sp.]|jgi:hypothetical protein
MDHYISPLEIKTFLVQVSEKINEKNLNDFAKTQLSLNDYTLEKNDYLRAIYLEESSQYFIFISKDTNKNFHFDAIAQKIKNLNSKYICCVNSGVMYIFKNKEIYYFQVLDFALDDDEINNLIYEKLDIIIEEILHISSEELNKINQKDIQSNKNLNTNYKFNYFVLIVFLVLILSILTIYAYNFEKEKPTINVKKYDYISKKLQNTLNILHDNKLEIQELRYDKRVVVTVNIKKKIFSDNLIKTLKKDFKIINMSFNHELNEYKAKLHVK